MTAKSYPSKLQKFLDKSLRKFNVPGASLAILRRNKIYATANSGVTSLKTNIPVSEDTLFQIGSITKTLTATLVMQLLDEGLIELDAPVIRYLPNFQVGNRDTAKTVTIRQLLSHQSGIDGDYFVDSGRGADSIANLLEKASLIPSLFPPGQKLSYCNLGFVILGRVTEVVTGQTWDQVLQTRLFDVLDMQDAFSDPDMALKYSCAIGHVQSSKNKNVWYSSNTPYLSYGQRPAGSTPTMTARDLLKFVQMHVSKGRSGDGQRVLKAASINTMQRQQIKAQKHSPPDIKGWGLGWMLFDWNGTKLYGHDGATIGQRAYLRVCPDKDIAVALLTNGGDGAGLFREIFSEIFEHLAQSTMPPLPASNPNLQINLDNYIGDYKNINEEIQIRRTRENQETQLTVSHYVPGFGYQPQTRDLKLIFIDKNTAKLDTGDEVTDRGLYLFSDYDEHQKAKFVLTGLRQYRR